MAKVSIVVPIYNVKDYLTETVGSLLRQTEREIEIILVDDGSTDGSGERCDILAEGDSRIEVLHKKNGGLSSARNAGVAVATSEYILFLDGDDYLCDDAIETLMKAKDTWKTDIVQFLYREVAESGEQRGHDSETWTPFVEHKPEKLFENLYRLGGVAASGCTKLMKRQLAIEHPFESIRHEDEMWCTRVFPCGVTIAYIPDVLYYYVTRKGSIIHARFNLNKLDVFKVQEKRIAALQKLSLSDLVEREYAKMFQSVLQLYHEASMCRDERGCNIVREQFQKSKKNFLHSRFIKEKYKLLLICMTVCFPIVILYLNYRNLRLQNK